MTKIYSPNVVRGGKAIPIGRNYYYMKGRKHKNGGIDIGESDKNGLEVEDGEVMHIGKDSVKVFSSVPFLNGKSPAEKVIDGENPNKVFNAQERFKDRNKLNDDGSKKAKYGIEKEIKIPERIISGDKEKVRSDYLQLDKKLIAAISYLAEEYDIPPQVLAQRISREKAVDVAIRDYNKAKGKNIKSLVDREDIDASDMLGANWVGKLYETGDIKTKRKIPFIRSKSHAEKNDKDLKSATTLNMYDAIELMAADMKYRKDQIDKKHKNIKDYNAAISAYYNNSPKEADRLINSQEYLDKYKIKDYISNIDFTIKPLNDIPDGKNNIIYKDTKYSPKDPDPNIKYSEESGNIEGYYNPILKMESYLHPEDNPKKDYYKQLSESLLNKRFKLGGLNRKENYISNKKPYTSVNKKDFAGNGRSYPIPTKEDAIDALKLAGLHHRNDVKNKVYNKYPELKKEFGGRMNKFVETNIFGKKKWIDVSSFTGGRKKAELGDEEPLSKVLTGNLRNLDIIQNNDINDSIKSIDNNRLNNTVFNREGRWRMEYPIFEDTDLIASGVNAIGSVGSFLSNKNAINKMQYSSAPIGQRARKLKTKININPQLDKIRENVKEIYRDIDANTASSRVALARKGRARLAAQLNTNELYGNKENIETELLNKDALNQQQVEANNIANYNRWRENKAAFDAKKLEMKAENTGAFYDNIAKGVNDVISKIDNRREANRILASELAKNPNVDPRAVRDMGARAIYLKPGETTKQARFRQKIERRKSNKK